MHVCKGNKSCFFLLFFHWIGSLLASLHMFIWRVSGRPEVRELCFSEDSLEQMPLVRIYRASVCGDPPLTREARRLLFINSDRVISALYSNCFGLLKIITCRQLFAVAVIEIEIRSQWKHHVDHRDRLMTLQIHPRTPSENKQPLEHEEK